MSDSVAEAAKAIVASMKRLYSAPPTMIPVEEAQFGDLKLAEYQSFRSVMEAHGFAYLADLELLEVSQSPTSLIARTMIRSMVSGEGHIVTEYYQVMPRVWRRLKLLGRGLINMRFIDAPRNFVDGMQTRHCVGFETEFDDGRFLITSNAQSASLLSGPPTIENIFFPYGTPASALLEVHQKRLKEMMCHSGGPKPIVLHSLSDLLQMQRRQNAQKIAHRSTVQWVTEAELQGMSAGSDELSSAVFAEVQKLLAQDGMTYRYEPIAPTLLDESNGHLLFQNVTDHYLARAGNNYGNVDNVENVPPTVRVVWRLWVFLAEVGGGGVNDYLWNHCHKLHDLKEVHAALVKVEATEMLDLLETGIRIALEERCGEFLDDAGALEWAGQFQKKVPLDSAGLDSRSSEIAHPKTSEIIAKFIRTNRVDF